MHLIKDAGPEEPVPVYTSSSTVETWVRLPAACHNPEAGGIREHHTNMAPTTPLYRHPEIRKPPPGPD